MIPFAILSGKIKNKVGEKEIRILELSPDSFTFRLLKKQAIQFEASLKEAGQQNTIVLSFFQFAKKQYKELSLDCDRDIEKITLRKPEPDTRDELAKLSLEIVVSVKNENYSRYAEQLNKEYMRYIDLKLEETEADLSKALVGYPAEKEQIYSESLEEQRRVWNGKNESDRQMSCAQDRKITSNNQVMCLKQSDKQKTNVKLTDVWNFEAGCNFELGIELDNPAWYQTYLDHSLTDFMKLYWKSSGISLSHPLTQKMPQYLYIGNACCPHLFPNEKQLYQLLERTVLDQICPVLVFAPVEEKDIGKIEQLLESLSNWCMAKNKKLELVINDWGMAGLLRKSEKHPFRLTLGCLLSKQRRDTRIHYINASAKQDSRSGKNESKGEDTTQLMTQFGQGPIQTRFYQDYLKKHFGITRVSFQSCGYHQEIPSQESEIGTTIHFPFFQMNTSGWCPLLATLHRKNRARQTVVNSCDFECMSYAFEYPDFLKMTGRYNTIFGYDDSLLRQLEISDQMNNKTSTDKLIAKVNGEVEQKEKIPLRLVAGFLNRPITESKK